MAAADHLGRQFGLPADYTMKNHQVSNGLHVITVHHPSDYLPVASMHFAHYGPDPIIDIGADGKHREIPGNTHPNDGVIAGIQVDPAHQRKGIATAMFKRAKEINPNVHHNTDLSRSGRAWAKAVGP